MFENGVLRRMFVPKKDETTEEWRKLNKEELNDLYSSANIILVIKSRRIRWVGHVARMGDRKGHTRFWWGGLGERVNLEDLGVDESSRGGMGMHGLIDLTQDRDNWRAFVNVEMNLRVP